MSLKPRLMNKRRNFPASITVIALVTVMLMLIIALALVHIINFTMLNQVRDAEVLRGEWFLEGRVQEYFDGIINGDYALEIGDYTFKEPIDGEDQVYTFEIVEDEEFYLFHAVLYWKDKYELEQWIKFKRLNVFDYVLFFDDDVDISLEQNMIVYGNIGTRGEMKMAKSTGNQFYYYASETYLPQVEYANSIPSFTPSYISNDLQGLLDRPFIDFNVNVVTLSSDLVTKRNKMLQTLSLPDFESVWNAFTQYYDKKWVLDSYSFYDTETIVNYLDSEKELIAFGDGYSTTFRVDVDDDYSPYVYLKKTDSALIYQQIQSLDYLYYYGFQNRELFYNFSGNYLYLNASASAISLLLDDDAYRTYGNIYLTDDEWSYVSTDEKLEYLYFSSPVAANRLLNSVDFTYDKKDKSVELINQYFYNYYTAVIGEGDGKTTSFPYYFSGSRVFVYVGDDRTTDFTTYSGYINFNTAPSKGEDVQLAVNLPTLYYQKEPPGSDTGIFIDKTERVVVLDLDDIQNYPDHGVIVAFIPILIRGEANQPLAVIGTENIYIEELNPEIEGEPVFIASKEGVYIYRPENTWQNDINKCVIYTPLDGLYTVYETGEIGNPPVTIFGSVFFSGENPDGAMDVEYFDKHFLYFDGITEYLGFEPFSIFPLPLTFEQIQRY